MNKIAQKLSLSTVAASVLIALSACGGGSSDSPSNRAPTAINLSANSVAENAPGATVGTLSATDPDTGNTFTYTTSHEDFEISMGSTLKLKDDVSFNYEKNPSASVSVTVTDNGGLSHTQSLTVNVTDVLDTYSFVNGDNNSTVSYSGQITRMALIAELNQYIGSELQDDLISGSLTSRQTVIDKLNSFYEISADDYDLRADTFIIDFIDMPLQTTLRDLSSSQKDLLGKIAGSDAVGQHKDWNNGAFEGWGAAGSTTPHELVQTFFGMLGDHAQTYIDGNTRTDFNGNEITKIYLTADGRDLKQLIQKFLLGALAFSQGVDDYLDNDTDS
ncbi:MAG: cadherin repeat domain-containing protein, partial [Kangiellaceae bacterium]|nr:cadherin repeat domain-containing protein [Kangiellaceae bacterium]